MDLKTLLETPPWDWPRDTGKLLRRILTDERADESDKLTAARMAGEVTVINDELANCLTGIIRNPEAPVSLRSAAAISLGPVLELADVHEIEDPEYVPVGPRTIRGIQDLLKQIHLDGSVPKELRRRSLEAAVRAPQDWQKQAIKTAYSSGDREWMLTAVFGMRRVRGFDKQILEALQSGDEEILCEAVDAAGNWEMDAAWPRVLALVEDPGTPRNLLLAAIAAVGIIRPDDAREALEHLEDSDDEEIAEAVEDALMMSGAADDEEEDEDTGRKWVN